MAINLSGNKGEWSEVYTMFRLLADGKLYGADAELKKKNNIYYNILEIIRNENIGTLHFEFDGDRNVIDISNENGLIKTKSRESFAIQAENLYNEIISQGTAAFRVLQTSQFLEEILCSKLKAPSADKADITIKVHDIRAGNDPTLGFSIKSRLGKPSTLLNAGSNTNFIFEIQGNMSENHMRAINDLYVEKVKKGVIKRDISVKKRMKYILKNNLKLIYAGMVSPTFKNNLTLIDSDLPKIMAEMMSEYYLNGIKNILVVLGNVAKKNPCSYDQSQGHNFYDYRIKKFLTESALGMLPGKIWKGKAEANGGYIIVREDGEVLCYHLYNRNDFENYLLSNTCFDRGSAERHKYAVVEKNGNKYYIRLNLQIRFIK